MMPEPITVASKSAVPSASATARRPRSAGITPSAAARFATLAAVFPKVVGEHAQGRVVGGVVEERSFAPALEQIRVRQPLQMVAQRRGGQIDLCLDVAGGHASVSALHDAAQNREPNRMAERAQLFGVTIELRGHVPYF